MFRFLLSVVLIASSALPVAAKPLLLDSQATYATACTDFNDTYERLIDICERGLAEPGASESQRLEMMNSLGNALMELEQYERSEQVFRDMLDLRPDSSVAYRGLGWIAESQDDCETALPHFQASERLRPTAPALFGGAICAHDLGQIDLDAALYRMETGLALDPSYAWGLRKKGWMLFDADRFDDAIDEFSRAIDLNQRDTIARRGRAASLRNLDRFDDALDEINAALAIDPDGAWLLAERSLILFYLGRNKMAAKDAQQVIDMLPDRATGYVRKARALSDLGRRGEALDLMNTAYDRIGPTGYLSYWYARLLHDDDQFGAAISVLKRLDDEGLADKYDFALMAEAQLARDYIDAARDAVERALALDPDYAWAIFQESLVLVESGEFDIALTRFEEAVAKGLDRDNYRTFNRHLIANGQFLRAIKTRARYSTDAD